MKKQRAHLAYYALLIASLTACARPPQPSRIVIISPDNPTSATHTALRVADLNNGNAPVNAAAFSGSAITTHVTFLAPSREDSVSSPLEIACYEPAVAGSWNYLRNQGGLAQIDANMEVHIVPPPVALDSIPFVQAMTDDGYVGEICTRDLKLQ
jgi:hypothetical protein